MPPIQQPDAFKDLATTKLWADEASAADTWNNLNLVQERWERQKTMIEQLRYGLSKSVKAHSRCEPLKPGSICKFATLRSRV
eukprot:8096064-Alexandrium_andersonii.AAC.1